MDNKKIIIYSIAFSILAHVVFVAGATRVKIQGVYFAFAKTKRFFNIDKLMEEAKRKTVRRKQPTHIEVLKFESPGYVKSDAVYLEEEGEIAKPRLKTLEELMTEPVAISKPEDVSELIEDEKDYDQLRKKLRRDTRDDIVAAADILDEGELTGAEMLLEEVVLPEEFVDKMPGFTPKAAKGELESITRQGVTEAAKPRTAVIERTTEFKDLNQYLVYDLYTYQDPGDGQKYYQLSIWSGKDAIGIKAIPKEIVFLVDCSLSIQPQRLQEFKEGLGYCLRNLNPEDYFNVIAFKKYTISFRESPVKPDKETIKEALDFVEHLTSEEGTDTYNALYKTIQTKTTLNPSYIILFSDGRPTQGVTDSLELINKITRFNDDRRPIFAFSGGVRVNRYFLDFISYKNRGWSEYARRNAQIKRHIANLYSKIKNPIFLNLRYRTSSLDEKEIFPRTLPDFFRNAEFTLFGTYEDKEEFSLQFLGDAYGKTNEFIIAGSLKDAAAGGKEIARNWAFNKIYYLIGLLEYDKENKDVIKEINFLTEKFGITTPYSKELE